MTDIADIFKTIGANEDFIKSIKITDRALRDANRSLSRFAKTELPARLTSFGKSITDTFEKLDIAETVKPAMVEMNLMVEDSLVTVHDLFQACMDNVVDMVATANSEIASMASVDPLESVMEEITDTVKQIEEIASEAPKVDISDIFKPSEEMLNAVEKNVLGFLQYREPEPTEDEEEGDEKPEKKSKLAKLMTRMFKGMASVPGAVFSGFSTFFDILNKFVPVMDLFSAIMDVFGAAVSEAVMPAFEEFMGVLMNPAILQMVTLLGEAFGKVLAIGLGLLSRALNLLIESGVLDLVIAGIEWFVGILDNVVDHLDEIWEAIVGGFTWFINGAIDLFTGIWDGILLIGQSISDFFTKTIPDAIKWLVNGFLGFINIMIDGLNYVGNLFDPLGQIPDIPHVPLLGTGGLVMSPTLAVVGDRPEIIIPLDSAGQEYGESIFGRGTGNGGNTRNITTNITATVFGEDNMRELVRSVYIENQLNGRRR